MKVLIFTHKSDIDGMGGAVLARLAFDNVDYVLCETFSLKEEFLKYYHSQEIYNYDLVFITDIWLEEPLLGEVANDEKLKSKIRIIDHHKTSEKDLKPEYDFITLKINDARGMTCGTSLFYEYLLEKGYLKDNKAIEEFVELTRRYDTWEWKTKYNDEKSRELTLLFEMLGCDGYIDTMCEKLREVTSNFSYTPLETMLINNKKRQIEEKLASYAKKIYYKNIMGLKAGIVFIDYEYRNELAEYLREKNYDIDFVMMPALDYGTVSYRSVKDNVNVRVIAETYGGKGHEKAGGNSITDEQKQELIKVLVKNENGFKRIK